MSTCTNCGIDFHGKFFSGGGLFTCPECFRLQQFAAKQNEALARQEELRRLREEDDRIERETEHRLERETQNRLQRETKHRLDRENEKKDRQKKFRSKMESARTFLNAGLFDDAVRSATEAAELNVEMETEALLDVSAIYICVASFANRPKLGEEHARAFSGRIAGFLGVKYSSITPATEDRIEIPDKWRGAIECLPRNDERDDAVFQIQKKVVAQIRATQKLVSSTAPHKAPTADDVDLRTTPYKAHPADDVKLISSTAPNKASPEDDAKPVSSTTCDAPLADDEKLVRSTKLHKVPCADKPVIAVHPVLRAAAASAAHVSLMAPRIWSGLKFGTLLGILFSVVQIAIRLFGGRTAFGDLSGPAAFAMLTGLLIGVWIKVKR